MPDSIARTMSASTSPIPVLTDLAREHIDMVYAAALRQMGDADLADEVTQIVFLLLQRKFASMDRGTILPLWLLRTTHFACRDARRRRRRQAYHERKAASMRPSRCEVEDGEPDLPDTIVPHLDAAMARLSEADRAVLVLRYYKEQSQAQIAQVLGLSEVAVAKRSQRALHRLRKLLIPKAEGVTGASLAMAMAGQVLVHAPPQVSATTVALLSGQAASASVLAGLKGTTFMMGILKVKIVALSIAAVLVLAIIPLAVVSALAPDGSAPPTPATTPAPVATLPAMPKADEAMLEDPRWWLQQAVAAIPSIADAAGRAQQYQAAATIYGHLDDAAEMQQCLEAAKAVGSKGKTDRSSASYAALAAAQAKGGDLAAARRTIGLARTATAGSPQADENLKNVASDLVENRQPALALEVLATIPSPVQQALGYALLADAQRRLGDREGAAKSRGMAAEIAQKITDPDGVNDAYWSILWACCRAGDVAGAQAAAGKCWRSPGPAQANVVAAYIQSGEMAEAQAKTEALSAPHHRVNAYGDIAEGQVKANDRAGAAKTLQEMETLAERIDDARRRGWAYIAVGRVASTLGDAQRVQQAAEQVRTALKDAHEGDELAVALVGLLADASDIDGARDAAKWVARSDAGYQFVAAQHIARAEIKKGQYGDARVTISMVNEAGRRVMLSRNVAYRMAQARGLDELYTWATGLEDPATRAAVCIGAADGLLPPELEFD